jgi:hypothetical protein
MGHVRSRVDRMTDPAIARFLELQRRGYGVVVQQEKDEVTVYLGRREAPIAEDVRVTAGTFAQALERAALKASAQRGAAAAAG